jgi:hypothetical protein
VQLCENDLYTAETGFWFDVNGDAASLVSNLYRTVGVQLNIYRTSVASKRLVD